jgi:hypothetical protein
MTQITLLTARGMNTTAPALAGCEGGEFYVRAIGETIPTTQNRIDALAPIDHQVQHPMLAPKVRVVALDDAVDLNGAVNDPSTARHARLVDRRLAASDRRPAAATVDPETLSNTTVSPVSENRVITKRLIAKATISKVMTKKNVN